MSSDLASEAGLREGARVPGSEYDAEYYDTYGRLGPLAYTRENPHWLRFFGRVADAIVQRLNPRRALDVGCAKGFLVESLRDRGVDAFGFDVSQYAISHVREDIRQYCWVGSAADSIKDGYDLIMCIEVCEHVSEAEATQAIREMTSHSDVVLFSSTPADFTEPTHVNVRPIIDWLRLFARFSFTPDENFDAGFICPWAVLFRRADSPPPTLDRDLCRFAQEKSRAVAAAELGYAQLQNDYRDALAREANLHAHPASGVKQASHILWDCIKNSAKARISSRRAKQSAPGLG